MRTERARYGNIFYNSQRRWNFDQCCPKTDQNQNVGKRHLAM